MEVIHQRDDAETNTWQEAFLAILPNVKKHTRFALQRMGLEAREDATSEVVACVMCEFRRLHQRGEIHRAFASTLVRYAVARYHDGRRVGTAQCTCELLSRRAQTAGEYSVCTLNTTSTWVEDIVDTHGSDLLGQVTFYLDFPRWLYRQTQRNRHIAIQLMCGFTTGEVARNFNLSSSRISQLRREFANSWQLFVEDSG
jgi:hypothetical protein